MCKIIEFPQRKNNAYKNMEALFEVCDNLDACNFYLATTDQMYHDGYITEKEMYTLRRIGRQKRLNLAEPKPQNAETVENAGLYMYTPEIGQAKPIGCEMEASRAYYGKHYHVDTPLELKGRGITFIKKYTPKDFTNPSKKIGWNEYLVTNLAFEKLQKLYKISMKCFLD